MCPKAGMTWIRSLLHTCEVGRQVAYILRQQRADNSDHNSGHEDEGDDDAVRCHRVRRILPFGIHVSRLCIMHIILVRERRQHFLTRRSSWCSLLTTNRVMLVKCARLTRERIRVTHRVALVVGRADDASKTRNVHVVRLDWSDRYYVTRDSGAIRLATRTTRSTVPPISTNLYKKRMEHLFSEFMARYL